jgi:hypothetical protein
MKQSQTKPSQANQKEEELGYFTLSILGFTPHLVSPGSPTEQIHLHMSVELSGGCPQLISTF